MATTFSTNMARDPTARGFDAATRDADVRAFIDWWNEKSFFPHDAAEEEPAEAEDRTMAA